MQRNKRMININGGVMRTSGGYRAAVVTTNGAVLAMGTQLHNNRNAADRESWGLAKIVAKSGQCGGER